MSGNTLSITSSTRVIALWSFAQRLKNRGMWLLLPVSALPLLPLVLVRDSSGPTVSELLTMYLILMAVLSGFMSSPNISEEIQNKTASYLWPRPFSRAAIYIGKLLPATLITALPLTISFVIATSLAPKADDVSIPLAIAAFALGTLACSSAASTLGALLPKSSMAVAIAYFMVDIFLGNLPFEGAKLSMTGHVESIASSVDSLSMTSFVWLLALGLFWFCFGLWRTTSLEPAVNA